MRHAISLTIKKVMDPFYAGGAAEVAFFFLMALVPSTILLAQLLHLFTISTDAIKEVLLQYLAIDVANVILPLFEYNSSKTVSILLLILALWAGSKAVFSLMRISNYAYRGTNIKSPLLNYIGERLRALVTIVIILIILIFSLYVLVFGDTIVRLSLQYLNSFLGGGYDFPPAFYSLRWVVAFILYFLMVLLIYFILPQRDTAVSRLIAKNAGRTILNILKTWRENSKKVFHMILPGSVFATVAMFVATWIYAFFMSRIINTSSFNILYGGLSSIVLLLLWFYVLAFILILGIQFNAALIDSRKSKKRRSKDVN